jgi:cytochrome b
MSKAAPLQQRRNPLRALLVVAVVSIIIAAGATAVFKVRFR